LFIARLTCYLFTSSAAGGNLDNRNLPFTTGVSSNARIEFHDKVDGNAVAVDLGKHQEEPIARAAVQILQDHAAAYTVQVEYADDRVGGDLGFQNKFDSFGTWDTSFLSGQMTGGNTVFSNGDLTFTGGAAGGGGMPVSNFALDFTVSWYIEVTAAHDSSGHFINVGIHDLSTDDNEFTSATDDFSQQGISIRSDGKLVTKQAGSATAVITTYGESFNGEAIGIYYDASNDQLWFYKNGKDLGNGSPAVSNVKNILTKKAYIFGYAGKSTDTFTMNSGLSEFKRAAPRDWKQATSKSFPSSTSTNYVSWDSVGSHRYWRVVLSGWTSTNNMHLTDLMLGKKTVTGLFCIQSRNQCSKTGLSNKRFICANPDKYVGSTLVDVKQPDHPQWSETCDAHLEKAVWSGVTWSSSSTCKDTPMFMQALEFMGVAGRCCSDGKTVCWKEYGRICSLSGKGIVTRRQTATSVTKVNSEVSMSNTMIECG